MVLCASELADPQAIRITGRNMKLKMVETATKVVL